MLNLWIRIKHKHKEFKIIVIDNTGSQLSRDILQPTNITLIIFSPYCSKLDRVEKVRQLIKDKVGMK
jgi:hypothetical protein